MPQPTPKPAPILDHKFEGKRLGELHDDATVIYIRERALEEILNYSERDMKRETGGWLLGGAHEDERPYVEIRRFLPAVHSQSNAISLTFTHDTLAARDREVAERFPDESVVGWHHTHPGLGVFLSGYDLFIHRNYFSAPWHVAIVVDPKQRQFGFFQWRRQEIVDCGFVCVVSR